jgi:hypothetical protein
MKTTIIFIFFVIACSCKQVANDAINNTAHINSGENEDIYESIDTTEFVLFWEQFRQAILKQDTTTLATMINDSVIGGWFLLRDYKEHSDRLSKSLFLENLYVLFTDDFLSLLKSYKINKFLWSNWENILWKKKEKKTYHSYVRFYYKQNETKGGYHKIANYQMRCIRDKDDLEDYEIWTDDFVKSTYLFIEQDIGRMDYIVFDLDFIKIASEIKLYSMGLSYNYSISD